jgi:hypothetical protein
MSASLLPVRQRTTADTAFHRLLASITQCGVTYTSGPASHNADKLIRELVHGALEFDDLPRRLIGACGSAAWISPGLAAARFLYLLTGRRDLAFIAPFSASVRKFSADGVSLGGSAYGARLFGTRPGDDQIRRCAELISGRPSTKRAAATLFGPYSGNENGVDVACCLGIVFVPRAGALDVSVLMRANDALRLLPYNVFEFSMLAEMVARLTGFRAGTYRHMAVSMHVRGQGDLDLAEALCAAPQGSAVSMGEMPGLTWDTVTTLAGLGSALSDSLDGPSGGAEDGALEVVSRSRPLAGSYWRDVIAAAAARGLAQKDPSFRRERPSKEWAAADSPLLHAELAYQRRMAPLPGA